MPPARAGWGQSGLRCCQDELTTLLTAGGVVSNVQLTGMVRPKTTVLNEKSPSVNVAVPASSGVQVPDSVTVTLEPFATAPWSRPSP